MKIGDVVVLKTGGPTMTVDEVRQDGVMDVVWFSDREVHRDAFLPSQVVVLQSAADAAATANSLRDKWGNDLARLQSL